MFDKELFEKICTDYGIEPCRKPPARDYFDR